LDKAPYANAVLDDHELQAALTSVNPRFGDLCTRVAGEVWGQKLIPQKWKAFFAMVVDVANQGPTIAGSAFRAHLDMAIKQGATRDEVEELMLFLCCYCGFNKVPHFLAAVREVFDGPSPPA
jgi:4-carboxymuconolactone decarboxylase